MKLERQCRVSKKVHRQSIGRKGLGLEVLLGIEIPLAKIAACSEETDRNFSKERARMAESEKATKKSHG
jgi:hypothetical protein